jgi:hypothetical protein
MFRMFRKQTFERSEKLSGILERVRIEKPLFSTGGLAVSPRIRKELRFEDITLLLKFHERGYWGNVPQAVVLSNHQIVAGERQGQIVSRYSWQKDEIMLLTERAGTGLALTKIYFLHDDVIVP